MDASFGCLTTNIAPSDPRKTNILATNKAHSDNRRKNIANKQQIS